MKFFTAALALTSTFYATVNAQCEGEDPELVTVLDLFPSTISVNELHLGGELRYDNVGEINDQVLDLVVTADDSYKNIVNSWTNAQKNNPPNGKENDLGKFGRINLQTVEGVANSGQGNFEFCIVKQGTNDPVVLDEFYWTTYDTDERGDDDLLSGVGIREKLLIDTSQTSNYQLDKATELTVQCEDGSEVVDNKCPDGVRTVFYSSTAGTGPDNPTDPNNLNAQQKARSISFKFENTACWSFTYDHYCPVDQEGYEGDETECRWYGGGYFLFAGESKALKDGGICYTPAPTMAPSKPTIDCPEDVEIVHIKGVTEVDIDQAVRIVSQDTTTVTVRLFNEWAYSPDTIDHIFFNYKEDEFKEECYEKTDVEGGDDYEDITIQCYVHKPFAELDICVADYDALTDGDNTEVPKCCHDDFPPEVPVVCYKIAINCESSCPSEAASSRALRGAE